MARFTLPNISFRGQPLEKGIVAGFGLSALVLLGIVVAGGQVRQFFDLPSFLIVVGGTVAATLVQVAPRDFVLGWETLCANVIEREANLMERMRYLMQLSQLVKRQGLLVLDTEAQKGRDPFLSLALQLAVDAQQPLEVKRILENELHSSHETSQRAVRLFETFGAYAPAMGLVGTLVGLIQMLTQLNNPALVGPSMALALVTTLYGAVLANLVFLPLAGKLRARQHDEDLLKAVTIEGILSITQQENPLLLEQRLQSFTPLLQQQR